jgi:hypothetical protein
MPKDVQINNEDQTIPLSNGNKSKKSKQESIHLFGSKLSHSKKMQKQLKSERK